MNIDKIHILINDIELSIYPKTNKLIRHNEEVNITDEKIDDLIRIIRGWKSNYYSDKGFDGNMFTIEILSNGKLDTIKGIRKLPDNFDEFKKFVRDLYGR